MMMMMMMMMIRNIIHVSVWC